MKKCVVFSIFDGSVTDWQTDRRTDGWTDGRTDGRTDPFDPLEIAFFEFLFAARVLYSLAKYTLQNFFFSWRGGRQTDRRTDGQTLL